MDFKQEVIDNILNLEISGDLIGENNGPGLVELINDNINKGIKKCIIDISNVRYMNSSGIGVLITILTKLRNKEGEVVLLNPSEQVKKLLLITKLNNIFTIYDSKEEALKSLID
ncbi:STAS domain-containing protein [Marivirga arenosa]|uniref:Anti-sigma factor antagonist n=1 Tax=Marivirga arenosa TaxID=3059076 RepID=A0AA51R6Z3_9BACT|nr:STAS domain-containing protein [Marivirga sp. ABR2-2]WMN07132.1 STAS domain-containing protein [Marivirga sp. ABR2-2]